ncbi:hypothetical protein MPSEU_000630300 [Mayamaea pseudoterrestris]|nr:hypothetical protein MPSEU_000630300 [Mayamaea pseudoterrestris]
MDGRFPFDLHQATHLQQQQLHLNQQAAQLRAALGIPQGIEISEAHAFLQAQAQERQRQAQERDLQIRQLLLQEQIDQHVTEQRLMSLREQQLLRDAQQQAVANQASMFPTRNDEYRNIILQEQLMHQRRTAAAPSRPQQANILRNLSHGHGMPQPHLSSQLPQPQVLLQDTFRRHLLLDGAPTQAAIGITREGMRGEHANAPVLAQAATKMVVESARLPRPIYRNVSEAANNSSKKRHFNKLRDPSKPKRKKKSKDLLVDGGADIVHPYVAQLDHLATSPTLQPNEASVMATDERVPGVSKKIRKPKIPGRKPGRPRKERVDGAADKPPKRKYTRRKHVVGPLGTIEASEIVTNTEAEALGGLLSVATGRSDEPNSVRKGTFAEIVAAAGDDIQIDKAAEALCCFKKVDEYYVTSENEECNDTDASLKPISKTAVRVSTATFEAEIPALPQEPCIYIPEPRATQSDWFDHLSSKCVDSVPVRVELEDGEHAPARVKRKYTKRKGSGAVTDGPPVDTWWPSNVVIHGERRQAGETSDEDNFDEANNIHNASMVRANDATIRERLANSAEPGVLEKLPHCKLHRLHTRTKTGSDEFAYCFQVTELYPDELMVNCTGCGTWRHAACGGHHAPYSIRNNIETPFVCVCDRCHEEAGFLNKYQKGAQRLERQRMEHIRRALATSAVMRHATLSEESTKPKQVKMSSSGNVNGHQKTREVHARNEKAEKAWVTMAANLSKANGVGFKEQRRIKAREFERLLLAVNDAEHYTDRHNMLVFLLRDTTRDIPVGFELQPKNIFDPEEWGNNVTSARQLATGYASKNDSCGCARKGCNRQSRFDSLFCSDGCGVLVLEQDLLLSLREAEEIHPTLLREIEE